MILTIEFTNIFILSKFIFYYFVVFTEFNGTSCWRKPTP